MQDNTQGGNYIARNITSLAKATLRDTPVMVIQGARQVGKSTLAARLAENLDSKQVTLDNPTTLQAAKEDSLSFVEQYQDGTLIIDEMQLYPELLRIIKLSVDTNRKPGRFILTGSADLLHIAGANESLAGRAETIKLYPFSQGELRGIKEDFVSAVLSGDLVEIARKTQVMNRKDYAKAIETGGYPEAVKREGQRRKAFFRNYLAGVIDHDAVELSGLAHLNKLSLLFSLLSAQTSGELVKANLAKLTQIPETSIHAYIKLLSDLCLIQELPTWGRNVSKRVVARTKISLNDVGLACHLNGKSAELLSDIMQGEAFGRLLESFAVSELIKQQAWSDADYSLYHFRDRDKREVDIVIELSDGRIIAIEVKATQTVTSKHFNGLRFLRDMAGERFIAGIVLCSVQEYASFGGKLAALPLSTLWARLT